MAPNFFLVISAAVCILAVEVSAALWTELSGQDWGCRGGEQDAVASVAGEPQRPPEFAFFPRAQ